MERACPERLGEIRELETRCFGPVDVFSPRRLRFLLSSPTSIVFIALDDRKRVVGEVIGLIRNFTIPSGRVYKVAVHPDASGKGLATKLIDRMERAFRKVGMKKACAEVRCGNLPSRRLFEKCGYHVSGIIPRYYDDGEDALKFWKIF